MKKILMSCLVLLYSSLCVAENVYSEQFQRIQSIELYEIDMETEEASLVGKKKIPGELNQLIKSSVIKSVNVAGVIMVSRELIAFGKEVYKIIEAGKPVVNVNSEPVSILPRANGGENITAFDLTNWNAPQVKKYKVVTKNYLGMTPASFEFMLIYTYGGKFNGKGSYIEGAQIKATKVNVKWGYSLDVNFSVQSIINQGSRLNPVAGAVLELDYSISTVLQEMQNSKTFFINGLGQTTEY
jgi:hypothetical protein